MQNDAYIFLRTVTFGNLFSSTQKFEATQIFSISVIFKILSMELASSFKVHFFGNKYFLIVVEHLNARHSQSNRRKLQHRWSSISYRKN